MKSKLFSGKAKTKVKAISLLAAILMSMALTISAYAKLDLSAQPPVNVTPPVTLGGGQTLRLNFFNMGSSPFTLNPCFLDADGQHLKMTGDISIEPGQTRTYDLGRAEAGRRTEPSVDVRGAVHADAATLRQLVVSGEVFDDATGKSLLFVPSLQKKGGDTHNIITPRKAGGNQAQEDYSNEGTLSLAPVGISFGQKLRLVFFNAGPRPFEVDPCFLDADGNHLKMGEEFTLAPGQTRSFEISRSEILSRDGRVLLRGALHVGRPDSPYLIAAGVIVDQLTGGGSLYVLPAAPLGVDGQAAPPEKN